MIDWVVVDVEIQKAVGEGGLTWDDTDKLGVAVAVVYEFRGDRFRIYGPGDVEKLKNRLLLAERISGYNIWRFDFPVIWGVGARARVEALRGKTDDLLMRIWRALGLDDETFSDAHKGWGLDAVASSTLGVGKIGYGGDAPKWFQAGDWARVVNYCTDDVTLERDMARFVERYGFVANNGRTLAIPRWTPGGEGSVTG
jgi:DEAD/DEAH box helicase domain-containing protein